MVTFMSALEAAVEELKTLPPHKLAEAVSYLHSLRETTTQERMAAWKSTGGSLTSEEADELARNIEECCERIDLDQG
jgi:hypothetical protein